MTNLTDHAREIAGKLSRGERRAIIDAKDGRLPTYYSQRKIDGTRGRITLRTLLSLERKCVIAFGPPRLTPLGLAVREELKP